jgi:hypothetical protein
MLPKGTKMPRGSAEGNNLSCCFLLPNAARICVQPSWEATCGTHRLAGPRTATQ